MTLHYPDDFRKLSSPSTVLLCVYFHTQQGFSEATGKLVAQIKKSMPYSLTELVWISLQQNSKLEPGTNESQTTLLSFWGKRSI